MRVTRIKAIIFSLTVFFICGSYAPVDDDLKNKILIKLILQGLNQGHYQPQKINDNFSQKVFEQYLKRLDYNKQFFMQEDIGNLKKYKNLIDDEVEAGTYKFFNESLDIITQRIKDAEVYYKNYVNKPFDFDVNESIELDFEKAEYAENIHELEEKWRKFVKYHTLTRLYEIIENQRDLEGEAEQKKKSFAEMEAEAREKTKKTFNRWFGRLSKLEERDRLSDYINSITSVYDPHTVYYAPKAKEDFDIEFSGRLEGIGARLTEKEGYISVAEIVPGSASWRQGELEVGDKILKVAQGDEEPVDIVGMRIDDAVRLIRGKKGTEVRLTVKKLDGSYKVIAIIRDVVIFEQTYAKSSIVEKNKKIGYIKLPAFYADFNDPNGRQSSEDVKKEIIKLKGENIKGLILDLRNNGGGSLGDVVEMAGLFIEKGPIVQVKSRNGQPLVLEDRDPGIYWEGPLAIMVNSFSASASEIMAAAIQDYGRGVIIGSGSQTFGKGTVQRIVDMDEFLPAEFNEIKPLGSIMLTTQKFYRIDGTTNQLKGVKPDVALPDRFIYIDHGEKDLDYPIPWDEISPAKYREWNQIGQLEKIKEVSKMRVTNNPKFEVVMENAERLKEQQEQTSYTLNLEKYTENQHQLKKEAKKYQATQDEIEELSVYALEVDKNIEQQDTVKWERRQKLHESLKKDIYLHEAVSILEDLSMQDNITKN